MKKRSSFIFILAALLCFCVLFASCDNGGTPVASDTDNTDTQQTETEEPIPENEVVDYNKIIGEWAKYLKYKAPSVDKPTLSVNSLSSYIGGAREWMSDYIYIEIEEGTPYTPVGEEISRKNVTYRVYNAVTGVQLASAQTTLGAPAIGGMIPVNGWNETYVHADKYVFNLKGCILEVIKASWVWNIPAGAPEGFVPTEGSYSKRTYNYYDIEGSLLNEAPLEKPENVYVSKGLCSAFGKGYYHTAGRIVKTFKAGEERVIPTFDFIYNNRGYVFGNDSFSVYDANYNLLANYNFSVAYDDFDREILSNGNVLVRYYSTVAHKDGEYTVEIGEDKYLYKNVIVNVATGDVTTADVDYCIESIVTPHDAGTTNLTTNGDYQFATIYKITDSKLAAAPTFAILDADLKIIAELPYLVKNQTKVLFANSAGDIVIKTMTGWIHSVNINDYSSELYSNMEGYTKINGGFLKDDKIYSDNMVELKSLADVKGYEVVYGNILVENSNIVPGIVVTLPVTTWELLTIDSGYISTVTFNVKPTEINICGVDCLKTPTGLYDAEGSLLITGDVSVVEEHGNSATLRAITYNTEGVEISRTHYIVTNEKGR